MIPSDAENPKRIATERPSSFAPFVPRDIPGHALLSLVYSETPPILYLAKLERCSTV